MEERKKKEDIFLLIQFQKKKLVFEIESEKQYQMVLKVHQSRLTYQKFMPFKNWSNFNPLVVVGLIKLHRGPCKRGHLFEWFKFLISETH